MTHTINIKCPNCKTNIEIVLDDNFNIVNINHKCKKLNKRILLGISKEGENIIK